MKKRIIILSLLLLTGCSINNQKSAIKESAKEKDEPIIEKKEEYTDNNPIKLGIYMYYNSYTNRKKLNEYSTLWQLNVDLCSLEIFYTEEESIPGTKIKDLWNSYKNKYGNRDN